MSSNKVNNSSNSQVSEKTTDMHVGAGGLTVDVGQGMRSKTRFSKRASILYWHEGIIIDVHFLVSDQLKLINWASQRWIFMQWRECVCVQRRHNYSKWQFSVPTIICNLPDAPTIVARTGSAIKYMPYIVIHDFRGDSIMSKIPLDTIEGWPRPTFLIMRVSSK